MITAQYVGFLNTPSIWEKEQFGIQQFEFPELNLKNFSPSPIPKNIRLGHQMEYVFKQLLEYSKAYEVVLHNLPIRQNKITLGEIDFILKDKKSQQLIHVELTYKFYIINTETSEPKYQFSGPNKRDMFYAKMEKIKNNQIPLLHSKEGVKTLKNNNLDHIQMKQQCCFKAQLFKPYGSTSIEIQPLNKSCIVGYWLRFDDFRSQEFTNYQFYIPSKSEWVIEPHHWVSWKSHFDIMMEISFRLQKEIAPMVWMRKSEMDFEKFFVVWWN